jgi:hypothetical protein
VGIAAGLLLLQRLVRPVFESSKAVLLRASDEAAGFQRGFTVR